MQATRRLRLQSVMQQELSHFISRELKDPRVPAITVTSVELTEDASQATVFISILGGGTLISEESTATAESQKQDPMQDQKQDQKQEVKPESMPDPAQSAAHQMKECLKGLSSASGFLRRHLAGVLSVRHVPHLIFKEDRGFENAIRVHELLKKI